MDTTPLLPGSRSPTPIKVVDDIAGFLIQDPERSFAEVDHPDVGFGSGGLDIDRGDTVVKLSVTGNPFHASSDVGFQFGRRMRIEDPQDQKDVLGLGAGVDAGSHTPAPRELRTRAHLELTPRPETTNDTITLMNIRGTRDPQRTGGGIGEAVLQGGFPRAAPEWAGRPHWQTEDEDDEQVDNDNCKEDEKEEESRDTLIFQKKNHKLEKKNSNSVTKQVGSSTKVSKQRSRHKTNKPLPVTEITPVKLGNKTPLPQAPRLERLKISLGEEITDCKDYLEGCLVYDDVGRKFMGYKLDPF
ncbi:uncharacterized protein H6S33_000242 [Morchella sextelata]|uniref:uncharacterized protein n=1 Tax=Morchella sextelata TaxID=1174677 RepID=UPI001D050B4E|nr:uncharacterized protein H6S33_000242 [Morchella sextelata]KAH0614606.1 hypothetical protein H6S33_000242 [Morchella sextelata]